MKGKKPSLEIALLLRLLDDAYDQTAWHGPNLRGSLRGMSAKAAAWRPAPGRHNIWELAVHAAYWKYAVARRLTGEKRGSFPIKGSNWFRRPETKGDQKAWREDLALLDRQHRRLRETIATLSSRRLPANLRMISGVAAHDLYHAGQIRLLKVLQRDRRGR
jgi:hypothetical protein